MTDKTAGALLRQSRRLPSRGILDRKTGAAQISRNSAPATSLTTVKYFIIESGLRPDF